MVSDTKETKDQKKSSKQIRKEKLANALKKNIKLRKKKIADRGLIERKNIY